MSIQDNGSTARSGVKTLAIRLEPETHAQLSLIAQLRGHTITDEIKAALDAHIAAVKTTPDLAARAGSVLEDIERDALARRTAIATLFGSEAPAPVTTTAAPASQAEADGGPATEATPAAEPSARSPRGRRDSSSGSAVKDS
jgi:predicted DNA-binding protein